MYLYTLELEPYAVTSVFADKDYAIIEQFKKNKYYKHGYKVSKILNKTELQSEVINE